MDGSVQEMLDGLVEISLEAGRAVLDVYGTEFGVKIKSDSSPLTEADEQSHRIIARRLEELAPEVPVLSEEGALTPYGQRRSWERFFLVDPLDGTKEFVNRNGEFTVNIALMDGRGPVMGVVHVPVTNTTYYAARDYGAFKTRAEGRTEKIGVTNKPGGEPLVVVSSRSHGSGELEIFLEGLPVKQRITRGSSLKFCMVAEGSADVYPRFGPTWEWDTAAAHCVVEAAGGQVLNLDGTALKYNKEVIKHRGFIALGKIQLPGFN